MQRLIFLYFIVQSFLYVAQESPFQLLLIPQDFPELGGLQSYAYGQANGKILLIGGRLDGLHRRQPFASFDVAGNNNQLIVFDPVSHQKWSTSLSALSQELQEQLSSTNMEFHQSGDYLYLVGGYGYDNASAARMTFPYLTAIHVPQLIDAILNNETITPYLRQITDQQFAVTGGHLKKIHNSYYLVGGNKFDGNYNPMGNPTYTQEYTNAIRKFNIQDDGTILQISHLPSIVDAANLHRRDYNVVAQRFPNGVSGLTAFSGVFQLNVDLPFLNCVDIDSSGHYVNNNFQQYYNHYHCAVLPIYQQTSNQMHTVFFGGIAQYYDNGGVLVQDNNVPFVRSIARVTREPNGTMGEYLLPIQMPGYMGAGSEFILNPAVPHDAYEIIELDNISTDTTLVGYIYGGIHSSASNIFFVNTGAESIASNQLINVYLIKNQTAGVDQLNEQSQGKLQLQVYPNPNDGEFTIQFNLTKTEPIQVQIHSLNGKELYSKTYDHLTLGLNIIELNLRKIKKSDAIYVRINSNQGNALQKVILSE
jgi:hypothetical protein